MAIELVAEAAPRQNLQVLLMRFQKDKSESDESAEVCTNYRYARRKAAMTSSQKPGGKSDGEKPQGGEPESNDTKKKAAGKPKAIAAKPGKKG